MFAMGDSISNISDPKETALGNTVMLQPLGKHKMTVG